MGDSVVTRSAYLPLYEHCPVSTFYLGKSLPVVIVFSISSKKGVENGAEECPLSIISLAKDLAKGNAFVSPIHHYLYIEIYIHTITSYAKSLSEQERGTKISLSLSLSLSLSISLSYIPSPYHSPPIFKLGPISTKGYNKLNYIENQIKPIKQVDRHPSVRLYVCVYQGRRSSQQENKEKKKISFLPPWIFSVLTHTGPKKVEKGRNGIRSVMRLWEGEGKKEKRKININLTLAGEGKGKGRGVLSNIKSNIITKGEEKYVRRRLPCHAVPCRFRFCWMDHIISHSCRNDTIRYDTVLDLNSTPLNLDLNLSQEEQVRTYVRKPGFECPDIQSILLLDLLLLWCCLLLLLLLLLLFALTREKVCLAFFLSSHSRGPDSSPSSGFHTRPCSCCTLLRALRCLPYLM